MVRIILFTTPKTLQPGTAPVAAGVVCAVWAAAAGRGRGGCTASGAQATGAVVAAVAGWSHGQQGGEWAVVPLAAGV